MSIESLSFHAIRGIQNDIVPAIRQHNERISIGLRDDKQLAKDVTDIYNKHMQPLAEAIKKDLKAESEKLDNIEASRKRSFFLKTTLLLLFSSLAAIWLAVFGRNGVSHA